MPVVHSICAHVRVRGSSELFLNPSTPHHRGTLCAGSQSKSKSKTKGTSPSSLRRSNSRGAGPRLLLLLLLLLLRLGLHVLIPIAHTALIPSGLLPIVFSSYCTGIALSPIACRHILCTIIPARAISNRNNMAVVQPGAAAARVLGCLALPTLPGSLLRLADLVFDHWDLPGEHLVEVAVLRSQVADVAAGGHVFVELAVMEGISDALDRDLHHVGGDVVAVDVKLRLVNAHEVLVRQIQDALEEAAVQIVDFEVADALEEFGVLLEWLHFDVVHVDVGEVLDLAGLHAGHHPVEEGLVGFEAAAEDDEGLVLGVIKDTGEFGREGDGNIAREGWVHQLATGFAVGPPEDGDYWVLGIAEITSDAGSGGSQYVRR